MQQKFNTFEVENYKSVKQSLHSFVIIRMDFTIKDLEALSGVKTHTIRIWEQRYHFLKPSRTQTNIRRYSNEQLKTLLTVALLNKYGYKISRIDDMSPEERKKTAVSLIHADADRDIIVNRLVEYMIDLKSIEFEELLNEQIADFGIERTVAEIVFYFLEKVGVFWHASYIRPYQEHIVSNIVRQKILSAIDKLPLVNVQEPMFCLLLPEEEYHELGLLFVHYLLRKNRVPVTYLGANVPVKDLQFLFKHQPPSFIYLHLTSFPRRQNLQAYISGISKKFPSSKILLSGGAIHQLNTSPSNVTCFGSLPDLTAFIKNL